MSALDRRPAIFLDRDGVILENREDYHRSWEEVRVLTGAVEALARVSHAPFAFVIVTNQSAVGRGLIDLSTAEAINARLVAEIRAAGGRIDGVFMCPHAPDADCDCRKPKPGLILQASEQLRLDLPRSILIGDALSDLEAARSAGVGRAILVTTGRGREQLQSAGAHLRQAIHSASDLSAALHSIPELQA